MKLKATTCMFCKVISSQEIDGDFICPVCKEVNIIRPHIKEKEKYLKLSELVEILQEYEKEGYGDCPVFQYTDGFDTPAFITGAWNKNYSEYKDGLRIDKVGDPCILIDWEVF